MHFESSVTHFPTTSNRIGADTNLSQRLFGSLGLYYENEIGEGNLRLSFGARYRYLNPLDPALTYDPISDYYLFRGNARTTTGVQIPGNRLHTPQGMLDILLATEIDRRAQINMSFLNILSAPYYNVQIYPRAGFQWRIDVTWAFLD